MRTITAPQRENGLLNTTVKERRILRSWSGRLLSVIMGTVLAGQIAAHAQVNVTTFHNDIGRTGQNLNETILTPTNIKTQFKKLFSQSVDAQIYAQPLYLSGITINGATHNVVFVATENDSVYAFDADSNGGANASPLWMASMLTAAHGAPSGATPIPANLVSSDIQPIYGITGTPVIDPTTNTIYLVSKTYESSQGVQRLHALDITTGAEKFGGPVLITASVPGTGNGSVNGTLTFDSMWENQRPGLLLLNGIVWIGFAAHGDNGPWHGWILGYNAGTLKQTGAYCTSPNGTGGGVWMSGGGLAADQLDTVNKPYGRMFIPTGNGDFTATKPYTNNMDYGDSEVVLDLTNGVPTVTDDFTTYMQANYNSEDGDIASGGLMLLPTQTTGSYPHLAVQVGKQGWMYVTNRDNMGGYSTTSDSIAEELQYAVGETGAWSSAAYWNENVYWWGRVDSLKSFAVSNGQLSGIPTKSNEVYGFPGATPSISANGNTNAIVWSVDTEAYGTGPAILQAHDATNVASLLYTSSALSSDTAGMAVKFATPTIANGKVYVSADSELDFYGLATSATAAATPVISPGSESYTGSVSVTITDTTANAQIYYTTDGSTPTTSSTLYTGAITVTSTETITALASATGYLASATASATYNNTAAVPVVQYNQGFASSTGTVILNGSSQLNDTRLQLTDGLTNEAGSAFYYNPVSVQTFTTDFTFQLSNPSGEGITFVIQNSSAGSAAIGSNGAGLGYAGIPNSVAIKFDLYSDAGEGSDSTGLYTGGATPTVPAIDLTSTGINLHSDDETAVHLTYNGTTLTMTLTDMVTGVVWSTSWTIDIPSIIGSNTAYVGFTGSTSTVTASQKILTWSYYTTAPTATPSFSPAAGTYTGSQTVTISDATAGATIYYTTNGTIPTTSSTKYTGPITVSSSETLEAIAVATGYTNSATATAAYVIQQAAATPSFSPAGGTYTSAQTVTISDATSGATIYYTTNGATPTTSSAKYTGAITVSSSETLEAIAVASGYGTSAVGSAAYVIQSGTAAAAPTFSPAGGTYSSTQTVTISDATTGATIYYTTTGATPSTSSNKYIGPITVATSETVRAIAAASGYSNSAMASAAFTIQQTTVATPTFSPAGGIYSSTQTVTISDATTGAAIYYTTTGATPSTSSNKYTGPITVSTSETVKAIAVASGYSNSAMASAAFTIQQTTVATPTFSPAAGTYTSTQTVTIGDATTGAAIYYTTNGTAPTTSSTKYTGAITVSSSETLKAIAVVSGYANSATATAAYVIQSQTAAAAPTFAPAATSYTNPVTVSMNDTTAGATIYYTTNGTTPTTSSTKYTGPISVSANMTIEAIAVASGYGTSTATAGVYSILAATPSFSPAPGTYSGAQTVTISDPTSGVTIYYSTNGTTPTTASSVYSAPITVSSTEPLMAIAVKSGLTNSYVNAGGYTINNTNPTATPVFSVAGGTYNKNQTVTISDATSGAAIYYTTDGSTPTTSSTRYTGSITISTSETLNAIALASGYGQSGVASATYSMVTATPVISLPTGTYNGTQTVTLTDSTAGAVIYYSWNGGTTVLQYTGPITVTSSSTLLTAALAPGYQPSTTSTATYTIGSSAVKANSTH